jgi:hypothetical protein
MEVLLAWLVGLVWLGTGFYCYGGELTLVQATIGKKRLILLRCLGRQFIFCSVLENKNKQKNTYEKMEKNKTCKYGTDIYATLPLFWMAVRFSFTCIYMCVFATRGLTENRSRRTKISSL